MSNVYVKCQHIVNCQVSICEVFQIISSVCFGFDFCVVHTSFQDFQHFQARTKNQDWSQVPTLTAVLISHTSLSLLSSSVSTFQTSLKYWVSEVAKLRKLKTGHCVDSAVIIILCWGSSTSSNHEVACWKLSSIQNQYYCWGSWTNGVRALGRWVQCQRIYSIQRREV